MLKQRVVTAIVLLAILLPALFASSAIPFTLLVLAMMAAASWEWGRLNGLGQIGSVVTALICLLLCAFAWQQGWVESQQPLLWVLVGGAWVLGSAALIRGGVESWGNIPQLLRLVVGVLALWMAWLAVAQARARGINFLLSIMMLVWVADIFAYFAGRAFGLKFTRNKLAPAISPGKSWEGAWGGIVGVLVLALIWVWADRQWQLVPPSFYSVLAQRGWWILVVAALFMAAMSVVGDLIESLIKRSAGVKDSSHLLPGHGGVLDRIDALLPTLPLAMMLTSLVQ